MPITMSNVNNTKYWITNKNPKPLAASNQNQAEQKDSYEKKLTKNQKIEIVVGLTALAAAITLLIRRKLKSKNIIKNKTPEPKTPPKPEEPKTPQKPIKEEVVPQKINYEKNGNPQTIIGIDEAEARKLQKEFKEAEEKSRNFKPWTEMTEAEEDAAHRWYREVETPLHEKIRNHNVNVIEKKTFSLNPNEQVEEKRKYIEDVIEKMEFNEASCYEGLLEFEKYGKREQ